MSGGSFNYFQKRYEWDDAIDIIQAHIDDNEIGYQEKTIDEFKAGLELIKKARIYMQRIDWLLSDDDGEDSFHRRLWDDLRENDNN